MKYRLRALAGAVAMLAVVLLAIAPVQAQVSNATIRGHVKLDSTAVGGATVMARDVNSGFVRKTTTAADGTYVLSNVPSGSYEIKVISSGKEQKSEIVKVGVGQTVELDLAVESAKEDVVVKAAPSVDKKSPEVGTNVATAQIENLPQVTRNFLAFADLAPGVIFTSDPNTGYVKMQSGAQNQDNVNVFIDGVGQKNYILRGGVAGLDSSRGNPFPQSAIAEYKVVTQNYKAEFDQVSSAAITAVTKSGGNEFHGGGFFDRTTDALVAYSPFESANEAAGVPRPEFSQNQYGLNLGGPIVKDAAHFFVAYEGKDISQPRQVVAQRTDLLPDAGIVPDLIAMQGSTTNKFNEDLFHAKIDGQLSDTMRLDFTARVRRESDFVPEDQKLSVPGNDKDRSNDETGFDLKHSWAGSAFFNEARIGYEDYTWNPHTRSNTPMIKYAASPTDTLNNASDVLFTGGSPDSQNRQQKGYYLQDDFTFSGWLRHTIKAGIKFKAMTFDLSGTARQVDVVRTIIDSQTGLPYYDPATGNCLAKETNPDFAGQINDTAQCHIDRAIAPVGVKIDDNMYGIYLQDDWRVSDKLELNLGIRWDYEDNALNNSYVTPQDRVDAIYALDVPRWGITPPEGQTYAESLAKGGVNIGDFISTGTSRKSYTGAIQPRIGFSYDFKGDRTTVLFGGASRAYDRAMANHALDEYQKNAQPHGEIWLIKNDHEMPYTDQFTAGLRQVISRWNTEAGYMYSYAHNQFNWYGGNRDANGGYANQSPIDPLWGGPDGYGTLILGDFVTEATTESIYLRADKPYDAASGWALNATYTYSYAQTTNKEWTNDIFNWTYGRSTAGWNPSTDVPTHRVVVAGLTDRVLPAHIMTSVKYTWDTGLPYRITSCAAGWSNCISIKGEGDNFGQLDLGLSKDIMVGFGAINLRLDALNVLNSTNYGGYDSWGGGPGNPQNWVGGDNAHLGVAGGIRGPMRIVKLGLGFKF